MPSHFERFSVELNDDGTFQMEVTFPQKESDKKGGDCCPDFSDRHKSLSASGKDDLMSKIKKLVTASNPPKAKKNDPVFELFGHDSRLD